VQKIILSFALCSFTISRQHGNSMFASNKPFYLHKEKGGDEVPAEAV